MLLYRSFVVGLLGACCLLLAERPRPEVRLIASPPPAPLAVPEAPAIVDVAAGIGPVELAQALHVPVGTPFFAAGPNWTAANPFVVQPEDLASIFAEHELQSGTYLDLMVAGRRILVLVH